jgi:hypothetical protein
VGWERRTPAAAHSMAIEASQQFRTNLPTLDASFFCTFDANTVRARATRLSLAHSLGANSLMFPLSFLLLSFACSLTTERSIVTNGCGFEAVTGLTFCFFRAVFTMSMRMCGNVNG